jgi:hypothetical protein
MAYEDREYGTLPVTAEEWRPYLAEYGEWYLSNPVNRERVWGRLRIRRKTTRRFGRQGTMMWCGRDRGYRGVVGCEVCGVVPASG